MATLANWSANFVVTVSFLTLLDAIHGVGVFFLFALLSAVALGYFYLRVPETKDLRLAQTQQQMEHSDATGLRRVGASTGRTGTTGPTGTTGTTSPTIGAAH